MLSKDITYEIEKCILEVKKETPTKKFSDKISEYNFDQPLEEQGIDSLDMIDILFKLQQKFCFNVDEDSIANNDWNTINKITHQILILQTEEKV